ncbi:cytochrome P450 [Streptosporangium oxazolinicum]|uniref:Cytochrome P450 n=1 Tax=Streptosporangium oxazolinicum TaxID=909287 RepID=A0ABP8ALA1_9ACTN
MTADQDPYLLMPGEELICPIHPLYYGVRAESDPRPPYVPEGRRLWLVTRYEDAKTILADPHVVKDVRGAVELYNHKAGVKWPLIGGRLAAHMLNVDPPDHTRLRRLVSRPLSVKAIERFRPKIEATVSTLLDAMEGQDQVDLISAFALPLPMMTICDLLGIPDSEMGRLHRWAEVLPRFSDTEEAAATALGILEDVNAIIEVKRATPGDDLISSLLRDHEAHNIGDDELPAMVYFLLVAGFEATVNLITNGTLALLRNPDQFALLRSDPALLPGAIDEFMRFDGPASMSMLRYTDAPVRVGGVEIPEGEFVFVSYQAANHDGDQFPDPDRLDITRHSAGHLGFGHGIHYCLGAPLARLEGEIAIGRLIDRFPDLALGTDPNRLTWMDGTLVHQLLSLPVLPKGPASPF